MAGSPMRRNSPPAIPGPSGISPATPAQQLASPADEPSGHWEERRGRGHAVAGYGDAVGVTSTVFQPLPTPAPAATSTRNSGVLASRRTAVREALQRRVPRAKWGSRTFAPRQ
ncbi:hypothetical protein MRX96_043191 [Rhipicephalus microplus]